jgi:hypothetical protein
MSRSKLGLFGLVAAALGALACAGGAAPLASPSAKGAAYGKAGEPPASAPAGAEGAGPGYAAADAPAEQAAPPPSPAAKAGALGGGAAGPSATAEARRDRYAEPKSEARPGLGTGWGETRESRTTTAPFVRDDPSRPFGVATLWYNDREGANAMARWPDYRAYDRSTQPVLGGALTVSLRDEYGRTLSGFGAGGKQYVIGEAGSRYIIFVQNHTGYRFECVTSVDGLDVIDGQPASYAKRGYLIQPHGVLEIDGWRRSAEAVAAFRFSSVRGSYANRSGQGDRNVGVIGVAFFNERGTNPVWNQGEVERRHNADPFPGRYATPPSY